MRDPADKNYSTPKAPEENIPKETTTYRSATVGQPMYSDKAKTSLRRPVTASRRGQAKVTPPAVGLPANILPQDENQGDAALHEKWIPVTKLYVAASCNMYMRRAIFKVNRGNGVTVTEDAVDIDIRTSKPPTTANHKPTELTSSDSEGPSGEKSSEQISRVSDRSFPDLESAVEYVGLLLQERSGWKDQTFKSFRSSVLGIAHYEARFGYVRPEHIRKRLQMSTTWMGQHSTLCHIRRFFKVCIEEGLWIGRDPTCRIKMKYLRLAKRRTSRRVVTVTSSSRSAKAKSKAS